MLGWQATYANMPQMRVVPAAPDRMPDIGCETSLDLAVLLPIELIRVHTKTDDIPTVTDEQLALYRQAAIESAEQYTGLVFSKAKPLTEHISLSINSRSFMRGYVFYTLQYPTMDGMIYLYGYGETQLLHAPKGTKKIRIPIISVTLDLSSACCRGPCDESGKSMLSEMYVLYKTGYEKCDDVPAGIVLGCLKYIAWCITHPGDEILAVRNRTITRSSLVDGTNNIAWASGALELWRQYDPEAI